MAKLKQRLPKESVQNEQKHICRNCWYTNQASAVDTKCRLKVGRLVEVVLEALTKGMTVGSNKIRFHFGLADHAVPNKNQTSSLGKRYIMLQN